MEPHLAAPPAPRRVLFALADPTVAHAFARIAETRSHVARVACSVQDALIGDAPDVVVADLGGEAAGLELVDTLRAMGHDPITVLVASAEATDADIQRAARAGIDALLERPLLPDTLMRAIEAECGCHHDEPEELRMLLATGERAAEDAARELVAWCMRSEVVPAARARIGTALAEAVQNASEHGASELEVTATLSPGELEVCIVDDGPGFDAVAVLTDGVLDATTGLGRLHCLADEVHVCSGAGRGTHVTLRFTVRAVEFDDEERIDLTDLDFFVPATVRELLSTLREDPDAPVVLSPALAVVVGRLLMGPDPARVLEGALRVQHG